MLNFHVFTLSSIGLYFASTIAAVQMRGKTELHTKEVDDARSSSSNRTRHNIVYILVDDLHAEPGVLTSMPNLRKLRDESIEFENHVSNSPLCGPSRASLLAGRLPHNSGFKVNDNQDSIEAFQKIQDKTLGKWLTDAGYYTAFLGKYPNGILRHEENLPKGWRYFGAFTEAWDFYKKSWLGSAYTYYNTSQWDLSYNAYGKLIEKDNSEYPINIWTDVHQADFLATQTLQHAQAGVKEGKPFFIFTNPVMVHHGYCHTPVPDDAHAFDDPWIEEHNHVGAISPCVKREHTQEYVKSIAGDFLLHGHTPAWGQEALGQKAPGRNCCDRPDNIAGCNQSARIDIGRRNRTGSLADLDDMVGVILRGLENMNVLDNTYVFFTSDNGFHLGEHGFWFGKMMPYDHDVRVPMIVRTPSGSRETRNHPTSHVDLTATIVDIADAKDFVAWELDGKSFGSVLHGRWDVEDWRQYSFSEMFAPAGLTWRNIRYVKPNASWSLNFWCAGEVEIFRLDADPHQMVNVLDPAAGSEANQWGNDLLHKFLPVITGLGHCIGNACNTAVDNPWKIKGKHLSELLKCEGDTNEAPFETLVKRTGIPRHEVGWD